MENPGCNLEDQEESTIRFIEKQTILNTLAPLYRLCGSYGIFDDSKTVVYVTSLILPGSNW